MMTECDTLRFTEEEIFLAVQQVWKDCCDDRPDNIDERIDKRMEAKKYDDIDLADIIRRLEAFFGFTRPLDEWTQSFTGYFSKCANHEEWERTVGPNFTFRTLARFIARHVQKIPLKPQNILGIPCNEAGAFLWLENILRETNTPVKAFGPSTRIWNRLRGYKLENFYNRVRWMTGSKLPPLRYTILSFARTAVFVAGLLSWFPLSILFKHGAIWGILFCPISFLLASIIHNLNNPLPKGIRTFGDLAKCIARSSICP